ncbi:MAG: uroporphyrinogen-III C-methyltransferase [Nevskiales bacterium]|nr:uroporphyrinogen-III C-methyltransferase [Nevskiales bacterium]
MTDKENAPAAESSVADRPAADAVAEGGAAPKVESEPAAVEVTATPEETAPRAGDAPQAAAPKRAAAAPARGGSALAIVLFLILAVGVAVAGGWAAREILARFDAQQQTIATLDQQLAELRQQSERARQQLSDQGLAVQRNAAALARFGERVDAQDAAVGALREEFSGGRIRVQLAIVEQLLVLAGDRLHVARDVPAAIAALEAADARLAALQDPRLFPVREAIANERAALRAVPLPDETGVALSLSSLMARAPSLPLAAQLPDHFEPAEAAPAPASDDTTVAGYWARARGAVEQMLSRMFTIRRESGPRAQLLSVEQEALIGQVLTLRIEGARAALLRGDAVSFRDLCESAAAWTGTYYNGADAGVQSTVSELRRLASVRLSPPLPDIGSSLSLLRAQMESTPQ